MLPSRAHAGDAGLDLYACEAAHIGPGERWSVGTGIAVEIPDGHAGLVLPRSGLAREHGIALVNSPGLIDAGYRGELRVLLLNTDPAETFRVAAGRPHRPAGADARSRSPSRSRRRRWPSRRAARAASAPAAAERSPSPSRRRLSASWSQQDVSARSTAVAARPRASSSIASTSQPSRWRRSASSVVRPVAVRLDQGAAAVVGVGAAARPGPSASRSPTVCAIDCGRTRSAAARSLTLCGALAVEAAEDAALGEREAVLGPQAADQLAEHDPQLARRAVAVSAPWRSPIDGRTIARDSTG